MISVEAAGCMSRMGCGLSRHRDMFPVQKCLSPCRSHALLAERKSKPVFQSPQAASVAAIRPCKIGIRIVCSAFSEQQVQSVRVSQPLRHAQVCSSCVSCQSYVIRKF